MLSLPYGAAVRLRNRMFDYGWLHCDRPPVPVVSIGNLTLGGTGKTPAVEYAARFYQQLHRRIAILSRGYGKAADADINDEGAVLEQNLPDMIHLQGPDRVALAKQAVQANCNLILLDDGFQHRRLARDLDIVVVDSTSPWGHDRMFPRGFLREPPTALARADLVMLTRCDQVEPRDVAAIRRRIQRHAPHVPVVESIHAPVGLIRWPPGDALPGERQPASALERRPVAAFCGIGNPNGFRRTLEQLGADVVAFRAYADHHHYSRRDREDLARWADSLPLDAWVVTTQKDQVKLRTPDLGGRALWALRIALQPTVGRQALDAKLKGVCT